VQRESTQLRLTNRLNRSQLGEISMPVGGDRAIHSVQLLPRVDWNVDSIRSRPSSNPTSLITGAGRSDAPEHG
jgi:hypothetical protein